MTTYAPPFATNLEKESTVSKADSAYDGGHDDKGNGLHQLKSAKSFTISPELFEKLYLSPETRVKGDLRKTFGNPTPLGLLGFILSVSPLACDLMGWRGAGGDAANVGAYYFMGGVLCLLSGMLEFFLGNTFPFVVFCSFGGFFLALGATLTPFFYAYGAFSPDHPEQGLTNNMFEASFGFFMLFMALLCFIYLICALRTNIVFVIIFFGDFILFCLLAGVYWQEAQGQMELAHQLTVAGGVFALIAVAAGWYIFFAQMLAALDFPFQIPVGDMSHLIKGASEKVVDEERYTV
ncbi:MAG: hypothetical protein M1838_005078 [Thelocarpon superellum]|nr:MAG: hypothetical protein M1838_005078 [Thelocarpon superellum]